MEVNLPRRNHANQVNNINPAKSLVNTCTAQPEMTLLENDAAGVAVAGVASVPGRGGVLGGIAVLVFGSE